MQEIAKYWKAAMLVITFCLLIYHAGYWVVYDKKPLSFLFIFAPALTVVLFAPAWFKKYGFYFGFAVIVAISPLMGYDFYRNGGLNTWEIFILCGLLIIDYFIISYVFRKIAVHKKEKKEIP